MTTYEELKARGLIAQVTDEEKVKELVDAGKAVFYIGFDPTADSLHVGHFIPIMAMSLTMSTFISQNLGAKEYERAKKGAIFGIVSCAVVAAVIGIVEYIYAPWLVGIFAKAPKAAEFGVIQERTVCLFYFLLAFSHSATGVLRGCGKSVIPMATMLGFWCGFRIVYVTIAIRIVPVFKTICWAYPITWSLSSLVFLLFLLKTDWTHSYEKITAR